MRSTRGTVFAFAILMAAVTPWGCGYLHRTIVDEADGDGDSSGDVDSDSHGDGDGDTDADADEDTDDAGDGNADADVNPIGTWVQVPPGTFEMGSPHTEVGRSGGERPHEVTLTRGFEIQATEVTQGQFADVMGYDPSWFAGCPECPVEQVNWFEAAAYCNALSVAAGLQACYLCTGSGRTVECYHDSTFATCYDCPGYRLPTEAEWEYAARAGTRSATYNGELDSDPEDCVAEPLEPIAWYCGNAGDVTHQVATLRPNAWGLYDMLGNLPEFTNDHHDCVSPSGEPVTDPWIEPDGWSVTRGGDFGGYDAVRAASRGVHCAELEGSDVLCGVRPVRTLQ